MKALAGGLALLAAAALGHLTFTAPTRVQGDRLREEYARLRRDVERNLGERRARVQRDALWAGAVRATRDPAAANPMLSLRKRVLAATERAGLRDVDLEVSPGREPYAAAARLSGEGAFPSVSRLLEEIDPGTRGFIPGSLRLAKADAGGAITFALELQSPMAIPLGDPPAAPPSPVPVSERPDWERDPFRFRIAAPPAPPSPPRVPAAAEASPEPAPSLAPARPAIRLVGLLRHGGKLLAVVSTGAQLHVLAVGGEAEGFRILAVDEDAVTVQEPEGGELTLTPGV